MKTRCSFCSRLASEIPDLVEIARENGMEPDEYVRSEDGTFNPSNGHFACDECYIDIGMPTAPGGWKAP